MFPEPVGNEESELGNCLSGGIKHSDGPGGRESRENAVPHWLPDHLAGVCVSVSPRRTLISLKIKRLVLSLMIFKETLSSVF